SRTSDPIYSRRIRIDYVPCYFFFFSSRRRHTRWPRDWSSDVCSSDLAGELPTHRTCSALSTPCAGSSPAVRSSTAGPTSPAPSRSEERRVGKECRSRWSPYYEKKNGKLDWDRENDDVVNWLCDVSVYE